MVRLPVEDDSTKAVTTKPARKKPAPKDGPHEAALKRMEERFGKKFGTVLERKTVFTGYETISTGSMLLDYKLGTGGLIVGRIHGFWGNPQSGKSTTAMRAIAAAQRKYPDRMCAWIDVENTFDWPWAIANGVDPARLYLVPGTDIPTAEEQADAMWEFTDDLISVLVIDSLGAMIPREEIEKDADEASVGTMAKIITRMVKKIESKAPKTRTAIIMINQVRDIIGPRGGQTTGGGNAAKHVESIQLKFQDTGTSLTIQDYNGKESKQRPVAKEIAVKIVKNKCFGSAGASAVMTLVYLATAKHGAVGIDQISEAFRVGKASGAIKSEPGGYYTMPGAAERVRSEDKAMAQLRESPALVDAVRAAALATVAAEIVDDEPELHVDPDEPAPVELDKPEGTPRGPVVVDDEEEVSA